MLQGPHFAEATSCRGPVAGALLQGPCCRRHVAGAMCAREAHALVNEYTGTWHLSQGKIGSGKPNPLYRQA
jgi:hypothetical protein